MRKYTENMFKGIMNGDIKIKVGNHAVEKLQDSYYFMYHGNIIMIIDKTENKINFFTL